MKLIKAIILVSLVICSFSMKVRRAERATNKVKTNTKDDNGSGSWKDGFNCPGFLVVQKNEAFNEDNKLGKLAKFYADKLEKPTTAEEKLGWVFEMPEAPAGNLAKIMIRIGTSKNYYIPFRWMNENFSYTNPTGFKHVEGWVMNDSKENFHVRLLLPWARMSYYISDEEGQAIVVSLNKKRTEQRGVISTNKSSASNAANSYITNKPLYDTASGDAAKLVEEQNKQKAELETYKTSLAEKRKTYETNSVQITELEYKLQTLRLAQDTVNAEITSLSSKIDSVNASLANTNSSAAEQAAKFKANLDKADTDLKTSLAAIKTAAPVRSTDVDAAQTAVLSKTSYTEFKTSIDKIYP